MLSNEIIDRTRQIRGFKANNPLWLHYLETLNNAAIYRYYHLLITFIEDRTHDTEIYQADFLSPVQ